MRRTRLLLVSLCLLALLTPAPCRAAEKTPPVLVTGAKVLDFGVFSSTVERRRHVPTVSDGIWFKAKDYALTRRGALVEARLGTAIGLRYRVTGAPRGAVVVVDVVVHHPPIVSPDTGKPMTKSVARFERTIGQVEHSVWSFDVPADLVPGEYVLEIVFEGRTLARQAFRVTLRRDAGAP